MKRMFTRFVALVLAVSLSLSVFVVPSAAVDSVMVDVTAANEWSAVLGLFSSTFNFVFDVTDTLFPPASFGVGPKSPEELQAICAAENQLAEYSGFGGAVNSYKRLTDMNLLESFRKAVFGGRPAFKVYRDPSRNVARILETTSGRFITDNDGYFAWCAWDEYEAYLNGVKADIEAGNTPAQDGVANPYRNKWVESEEVNFVSGAIATKDALASALIDIGRGELWAVQLGKGKYYVLYDKINDEFWCNLNNQCWMAPVNNDHVIINQKLDYIIDKIDTPEPEPTPEPTATPAPGGDDSTIWNGSIIDLSNSKFSLVDELGSLLELNIDNVIFDFATKNYTVNCFDIDFNYYTYNVQYTYNNTYVTYIGSTAEYQPKEYELYYQLPDGRSSADLFEEDIAGLSFQFADVVNYKRAVTDESLLALYHFDGDVEDDSYYSYPLPRNNSTWKALPEGYTQLEYIESTGTQYIKIDDPVVHCNGLVDLDFQFMDDRKWTSAFGIDGISNGLWEFIFFRAPTGVRFYANDSQIPITLPYDGSRCHAIFDFSKGTYSIAGKTGSLVGTRPGSGWLSGSPFYLFANSHCQYFVNGRFYGLKTSSPSSAIHSYFIPCISPSGEVGVYNNAYYLTHGYYPANPDAYFYGNSGSGDFIAGPAVKSQLQSSGMDYPRFVWTKGASINYMESNAFNGALYLDETEHEFKINLPKTLGRDFSVYFRYYQNSSKDTNHVDNYISSNGNKLLSWSEQHMYAPDGHQLTTPLSVGSWQEIALFRKGHDLHIYHNGIKVETVSLTAALSDSLVFHLGSNSRAYSMVDEIRILDFPRTTWGSYTPTVVPMDTNEVLVLPGTKVQVSGLDTYYNYEVNYSSGVYSLFDGLKWADGSYDVSLNDSGYYESGTAFRFDNWACYDEEDDEYAWARPEKVDRGDLYEANFGTYEPIMVIAGDSEQNVGSTSDGVISVPSVTPSVTLSAAGDFYLSDSTAAPLYLWGVKMKLNRNDWGYLGCYYDNAANSYFNIVFDDYSIARVPVTWGGDGYSVKNFTATSSTGKTVHVQFVTKSSDYWSLYEGAYLQYYTVYDSDPFRMFWIGDASAVTVQNFHDYYNTATESIAANTAALQTDIPIRSYLVGGVRPIFPELGDVWMMVEGRRITSVQIYNGRAWEEVAARWWTGSRWIPIYAFDIVTLADMWDVTGSDGTDVTPTITTETGFWNWWKNQWLSFIGWVKAEWADFRKWLSTAIKGNKDIDVDFDIDVTFPGGHGWSFLDLLKGLKDAIWGIVKGIVGAAFGGVAGIIGNNLGEFFDEFTDSGSGDLDSIFGVSSYGGADIWD